MTPGLEFREVSHAYDGKDVVRELSLSVGEGEIVCLLGPSGCGKTTSLRLAAGLEKLQQGEILVNGRTVSSAGVHIPPEDRRSGLVLQDYALFPHLSVLGNVMFGLDGLSKSEAASRAHELLRKVGLEEKAESWPHMLSGGEQQRVALVRAMAPEPVLMLMDEPFSGLDVMTRAAVRESARQALLERGVPSLIVTHDPEEALSLGDRIAVMLEGKLVQVGDGDDIYDNPSCPFVMELFGAPNRLPGIVAGGQVATPFGPCPAQGFSEGVAVLVMFREDEVTPDGTGAGPAGSIVDIRPLGPKDIAVVRPDAGGADIFVHFERGHGLKMGQALRLAADSGSFRLFPDEA